MIEPAARTYAAAVRPALEASETKQGLAKALRQAAVPLVKLAAPSDDGDVAALDGAVALALAEAGILPGCLGRFARCRVHEMAELAKRPKVPAPEAKDTLRDELLAIVRAVRARSSADLPAVDQAVIVVLKERGVAPNSREGLATCATETPGALVSRQIERFSSALKRRYLRRRSIDPGNGVHRSRWTPSPTSGEVRA